MSTTVMARLLKWTFYAWFWLYFGLQTALAIDFWGRQSPKEAVDVASFSHEIHHNNFSYPEKLSRINQTLDHLADLNDADKLEFYMLASQTLTNPSPKRALNLANAGFKLAKKNQAKGKETYFSIKQLELADDKSTPSYKLKLAALKEQLDSLKPSFDKSMTYLIHARINDLLGNRYEQLFSLYSGLDAIDQCDDSCDEVCTNRMVGLLNNEISNYFMAMEEPEKSRPFLQRALNAFEKINDRSKIGVVIYNLALIESQVGNHTQAIEHLQKVIAIKTDLRENFGLALSHMHLGRINAQINQPRIALEHLNTAIPILHQSSSLTRLASAYLYLGEVHHQLGQHNEADKAFMQSIDIAEENLSPKGQFKLYQAALNTVDQTTYPDRHRALTNQLIHIQSKVIEDITTDINKRAAAENELNNQLQPQSSEGTDPNANDARKMVRNPLPSIWFFGLLLLITLLLWGLIRLKRANTRNLMLANTDELTGILNRRSFFKHLNQICETRHGAADHHLLFLDIDHFKTINDRHGHSVGDYVLKTVVNIIEKTLPSGAIFGRIGGEEFALICAYHDSEQSTRFAERIRMEIEQHQWLAEPMTNTRVTISIGVTHIQCGQKLELAYERADKALYLAKQVGRNTVCTA